ncbi:thioredoxin domain-containing protein [Streptomyces fungicidicus]|uniref:hypothetical protein n=1 Tax=Streptomyces fungicidicus TaxID=68203 RepID=UPI003653C6D5
MTFVIRYFPLPGHRNAELAATAVETAASEDMQRFPDEFHALLTSTAEQPNAGLPRELV